MLLMTRVFSLGLFLFSSSLVLAAEGKAVLYQVNGEDYEGYYVSAGAGGTAGADDA